MQVAILDLQGMKLSLRAKKGGGGGGPSSNTTQLLCSGVSVHVTICL